MFGRTYPKLNMPLLRSALSADDYALVEAIVKKDGTLRASKPVKACGEARYLWRHVAFSVSPDPRHHCMPCSDICDLPGRYGSPEFKAAQDRCEAIEKVVTYSVPRDQWYGVRRWGQAFGYC